MKKLIVPLSISALLLLTSCGSEANTADAPSVEPAAPAESPTPATEVSTAQAEATEKTEPSEEAKTSAPPEPEKSDRGNLIKAVGQGAGMSWEGEQIVDFVVNSITVDAPCTAQYATPAENGHLVVLDVSVKTHPALAENPLPQFVMSAHDWKAIAPNGTTSNASPGTAASYSCLPQEELLPQSLGPAEQATGKVVLDLQNPEGILVYKDPLATFGWEWTFPAP